MSDKKYLTRMGDGEITYMTKDEIREDVPVDASSRVAKCLMEIGKADGL